jgi:hypothetical protein
MTLESQQRADFMFEGLQALQHVDIPSAFDAARNAVYNYHPSFGDMSALPIAMNAPNFPKWAKTAKETYKLMQGINCLSVLLKQHLKLAVKYYAIVKVGEIQLRMACPQLIEMFEQFMINKKNLGAN